MQFIIPGDAKAKQRPKFSTFNGVTRAVTPKETVQYENWVKCCFNEAFLKNGLDYDKTKAIQITIDVYYMPLNQNQRKGNKRC